MSGQPGAEILAPLAIVVLGGLVSSTALNLVVVPAAYAWVFGGTTNQPPTSSTSDSVPVVTPADPVTPTTGTH
jgi:hypothetical protein